MMPSAEHGVSGVRQRLVPEGENVMALSKGIGMRFSELKDNYENAQCWEWDRKRVKTYTRFGVLPNGEGFGVARTPTQENYYARDVVIVSTGGEIRACGWIFPDGGIGNHYPEPEVMIASPSAKTIVWLGGGELWIWLQNEELQCFTSGSTKRVDMPDGAAVLDAYMNEDGTLDLWCEGGARHVYSCDEDVLLCGYHAADLRRSADKGAIVPSSRVTRVVGVYAESEFVRECMDACLRAFPEVAGFLIEGDFTVESWGLCGMHARELRFAPEVERIDEGEFAVLGELERVIIPATVQMVESCAFEWCGKLTDIVIEGDLSRVAGWHENAFEKCPCEDEYLNLRRKAAAGEL